MKIFFAVWVCEREREGEIETWPVRQVSGGLTGGSWEVEDFLFLATAD